MSSVKFNSRLKYSFLSVEEPAVGADGIISGNLGNDPVNTKAWKTPPHVALANLSLNPQAIASFIRKYGTLGDIVGTEGQADTEGSSQSVSFILNPSFVGDMQSILRLAWRADRSALLQIEDVVKQINLQVVPSLVRREEIVVKTSDLWKYLCFAFSIDYIEEKTKTCTNPDCEHPYFVQKRKDQQFCSHRCAVVINVQRYRERQSETE